MEIKKIRRFAAKIVTQRRTRKWVSIASALINISSLLYFSNCQEAPQAKIFSFLERFANDLPSKMIISKGKPQ